jgi:hypothetical protein
MIPHIPGALRTIRIMLNTHLEYYHTLIFMSVYLFKGVGGGKSEVPGKVRNTH